MSLRILILSRYDQLGASSRLRMLQYIPALTAKNAQITVSAFLDDNYISSLYQSKNWFLSRISNWKNIVDSYIKRFQILTKSKQFDVVWVEKELFVFLPGLFESLLAKSSVPYVIDYDDAVFHNYDQHRIAMVRLLLGNKLKPLLTGAYAVTAGNEYLAEYANRNGAAQTHIIPTVVDLDKYQFIAEQYTGELRIGWIGSPATAHYLHIVADSLRQVAKQQKIKLVTIGAPNLIIQGVPIESHPWSFDSEAELLSTIHVGIMPLTNSLWEQGKCGYKLIQYMACGRPVIASPVGVNSDIVSEDIGFLAHDTQSWSKALLQIAENPLLRTQFGDSARQKVQNQYSLQVTAPKITTLLQHAAGREL